MKFVQSVNKSRNKMDIREIKRKIGIVIVIIGLLCLGWVSNVAINEIKDKKIDDEVYSRNYDERYFRNWNSSEVDKYTDEKDNRGDWVCVNIKGMKPKRALEVCRHEVGHEIFAEHCEQSQKGFDDCMKVVENG